MKKIALSLLLVGSLFGSELNWINDYSKAIEIAKKEHKDIYLFIGADSCRYCSKFKKETLSKKDILHKLNQDFIPLYLSRDQHEIPDKFELFGVPRHYFLNSMGKVYDEEAGFLKPELFLELLKEAKFYK